MSATASEVESVLQSLEKQFAHEDRSFRTHERESQSSETMLAYLLLALLLLCAATAITGARYLIVHGTEVWNGFVPNATPRR